MRMGKLKKTSYPTRHPSRDVHPRSPAVPATPNRRLASAPRLAAFAAPLLNLAGCATSSATRAASETYQGSPSVPRAVSITRSVVLPAPPVRAFDLIAAEDVLPKVLTGYGPLPAVTRTSGNTGPWDVPGSQRLVHLADGSTVREEVTRYERGTRFAYRVSAFGNPLIAALATEGRGDWTFEPVDGGTRVRWTYTFDAKGALASVPLQGIVRVLWRGYMDVCLENARRILAGCGAGEGALDAARCA